MTVSNALNVVVVGTVLMGACVIDFDQFDPRIGGGGGANSATKATGDGGGAGLGGGGGGGVGGGGTGGEGNQDPSVCGGPGLLNDDFEANQPGRGWATETNTGGDAEEEDGQRVVTLSSANNGSSGRFTTERYYDLRGAYVRIEVTETPTGVGSRTFLGLIYDSDLAVYVQFSAGQVSLVFSDDKDLTVLGSVRHDPNHTWLQLREQDGELFYETSADGIDFVTHGSAPLSVLFPMDLLFVEHGAEISGPGNAPGVARFDRLMGGGPPTATWCAINTLQDNFDNVVRARIWQASLAGCSVSQPMGALRVQIPGTAAALCLLRSLQSFDLSDDALFLELPWVSNLATSFTAVTLEAAAGQSIALEVGPSSAALTMTDGIVVDAVSVGFDPKDESWLRLRESNGVVFLESSSNGLTWAPLSNVAVPFSVTELDVTVGAGLKTMQATGTSAEIDNINLPP